jgi:hypothetical protein
MYDSWSLYDEVAFPSVVRNMNKVKDGSRKDMETTINYASYRCLSDVFGPYLGSTVMQQTLDAFFMSLGGDMSKTESNSSPEGLGNEVARQVIAMRDMDGTNAKGTEPTSSGAPYSDYTNYSPTVQPMPVIGRADCATVPTLNRWQPARTRNPAGGSRTQTWGDVHFANAKTFGMIDSSEFRPVAPPLTGTLRQADWNFQIQDMLNVYGTLDDAKKAQAYYWMDGLVKGESPTGHLTRFAILSAIKARLNLEDSIKLFFIHSHGQLDAMIAQFEGKRFYDPPRPTTPMQCTFAGQQIKTWRGPYMGVGMVDGSTWSAYLPDTTVQNGTPEYPCGHCTISGTSGEILRLFYDTEEFIGDSVTIVAGSIPLEMKILPGQPGYIAGLTDIPNSGPETPGYAPATDIVLSWRTWTEY